VKFADNINIEKNIIIGLEFQEVFPADVSMNKELIKLKVILPSKAGNNSDGSKSLECVRTLDVLRYERGMYFIFDEDWKMTQGKWVFQIEYKGVILLEKSFDITFSPRSTQTPDLFSLVFPLDGKNLDRSLDQTKQGVFLGLLEYGVYDSSLSHNNFLAANLSRDSQLLLIPNSDYVCAKRNTTIGINCLITTASCTNQNLIFKILPPCHMIASITQEQSQKLISNFTLEQLLTKGCACLFSFDEDWKCVSGDWVIQISLYDKVLVEKTFHVFFKK
jgi:hypothetical protein